MTRFFILIATILISFSSFGQDTISRRLVKKFIPLNAYERFIGKTTDTTEFMFRDGDTLVSVPLDFDPLKGKNMVKVEYEPKDSVFLNIYKEVVYNPDNSNSSDQRMHLWKDDINIYFDEGVPEDHANELMKFAAEISKDIDSLNISRKYDEEKANYVVYYLNEKHSTEYEPKMRYQENGYYIGWNGKQQIYKGHLKINTEFVRAEFEQKQLLKSNFFKSLGHFKTSDLLTCGSYLSKCPGAKKLSPKDLEILSYHYSYGVCKGVDLKTFTEQTNRMNKKLEEDPDAKLYIAHHE